MFKKITVKILAVTFTLALLACVLPLLASADGEPAIVISSGEGRPKDKVSITVSVENNPGIIGFFVNLKYDASRLKLTEISENDLLGAPSHGDISKNPVVLSWDDSVREDRGNNKNSGTIVTLEFEILAKAPKGDAEITINYSKDNIFAISETPGKFNEVYFAVKAGKINVNSDISPSENNSVMPFIIACIVAVLVGGAIVFVIIKKRKSVS